MGPRPSGRPPRGRRASPWRDPRMRSTVSGQFCIKPSMLSSLRVADVFSRPYSRQLSRTIRRALREEARGRPGAILRRAGEQQSLVQSERPVAPELDLDRLQAIAAPVWRTRHLADAELQGVLGHPPFQGEAVGRGARLVRGPGADLGRAGAAGEVGVRPRPRSPARSGHGCEPGGAATSSGTGSPPPDGRPAPDPWRSGYWCRR